MAGLDDAHHAEELRHESRIKVAEAGLELATAHLAEADAVGEAGEAGDVGAPALEVQVAGGRPLIAAQARRVVAKATEEAGEIAGAVADRGAAHVRAARERAEATHRAAAGTSDPG